MTRKPKSAEELKQYREMLGAKYKAYMLALGRFVSEFSNVEAIIQTALWKFSGVAEPTAQAVFSGVRIEGCIQFINRIAAAQKWSKAKKNELEHVLSHLGKINKLRNDILHYGSLMAWPLDDLWLVTNKQFVHMPERIREIRVSPKLLDQAKTDLETIQTYLFVMMWDEPISIFHPEMQRAWLYKSPPQGRGSHRNRRTRQTRPRQRPSSEE